MKKYLSMIIMTLSIIVAINGFVTVTDDAERPDDYYKLFQIMDQRA
ncbi:hypothetical protein [Proteiniclasticum sp. QWL-01]|nr:hypothetical protein [Proteiniclasticum sp. QWL-01]WFF73768.1 hypothetical protein P6M73_04815 [Proteiniclasticum sp. QWL-01]